MEIESLNKIYAFNRFEEEGHVERRYSFRLKDLTRKELYTTGVPAILDDNDELLGIDFHDPCRL